MLPKAGSERKIAARARPLAELLQCPPGIGALLNEAAVYIDLDVGEIVFRQPEVCRGLYVVIAGQYLRRTERLETRLTLGVVRAGDVVELAAVLGDGRHTYTLSVQTHGSVLLLPMEALNRAFEAYPQLRMQLLEELAREVSRGYDASCQNRAPRVQRRSGGGQVGKQAGLHL
jgi:CRP-like cAMP-binding protein